MEESVMIKQGYASVLQDSREMAVKWHAVEIAMVVTASTDANMRCQMIAQYVVDFRFVCPIPMDVHVHQDTKDWTVLQNVIKVSLELVARRHVTVYQESVIDLLESVKEALLNVNQYGQETIVKNA
ncbi:uncharacterized protein LOC105439539 [Strongylocentrotus purpuratus]|uniref:Uncharacterized protein n=1 Tax=Strongylocentrotus purpuratus TaxID=7668 RepID=A0A7M7PMC7_STRPU|nr:uncharacterized protein LOC105439539 [Strongylocentrotus purpuratus]